MIPEQEGMVGALNGVSWTYRRGQSRIGAYECQTAQLLIAGGGWDWLGFSLTGASG